MYLRISSSSSFAFRRFTAAASFYLSAAFAPPRRVA
jgi:hypothetical protein